MNDKVVVGFELQQTAENTFLVLGLVAVFKTHAERFESVEKLAKAFAPWPIDPVRVPQEEGWDRVGDLPKAMWGDLISQIAGHRAAEKQLAE